MNTKVALPSVHMAGQNAHYDAHIEVGHHGFALFLAPGAEYPILDVDGTVEQLTAVVEGLQAALASRGHDEPASPHEAHDQRRPGI